MLLTSTSSRRQGKFDAPVARRASAHARGHPNPDRGMSNDGASAGANAGGGNGNIDGDGGADDGISTGTASESKNTLWAMMRRNRELVERLAALQTVQDQLRDERTAKTAAKEAAATALEAAASVSSFDEDDPLSPLHATSASQQPHQDGLCDLPEEVLTLIMERLDSRGICSLAQTCLAMRDAERDAGCRAACWQGVHFSAQLSCHR